MHFTLAIEKVKKYNKNGSSLGFMSILLDHEGMNLLATICHHQTRDFPVIVREGRQINSPISIA